MVVEKQRCGYVVGFPNSFRKKNHETRLNRNSMKGKHDKKRTQWKLKKFKTIPNSDASCSETVVGHFRKGKFIAQKMASYLHHTAQPFTFAAFPPWRIQQELVV